jgi:spermidine synthase
MATVWSKRVDGRHHEVRRAGRSVRLYTDGVFHSQYNPANPISATVWTLLVLPAFLHPTGGIGRVLVLGVGGGAVIRLLHDCLAPEIVIGVDRCPTHLHVARRFFGVSARRARLEEADATQWLMQYRGPKFDLIIDDLFGEADGAPVRAVTANRNWLAALAANLADDGVLAMNFVDPRELSAASRLVKATPAWQFERGFRLTLPHYENAIAAFVRAPATGRQLRQALEGLLSPARFRRLACRIQHIRT